MNRTAAQPFVQAGLDRLNSKAFAEDLWAVLAGKPNSAQIMLDLAGNFRQLSDDDLTDLCAQLSPTAAAIVRNMVVQLRANAGPLTAEQVQAVLEKLWTLELAKKFKSELTRLQT